MENLITAKLKSVIHLSGKTQKHVASHFGITQQAFNNKLSRGSFSAEDLIKLCIATNSKLTIELNGDKIILDESCIRN